MRTIALAAGVCVIAMCAGCGAGTPRGAGHGLGSVDSVSCGAPGACVAGGTLVSGGHRRAFVMDEANGSWGEPVEVPGVVALNKNGESGVDSVSCAAAGECAVGGHWVFATGNPNEPTYNYGVFLVDEVNGKWGTAIGVPGLALDTHYGAELNAISCAAPGECAAGGSYYDQAGHQRAFLVSESKGAWGAAVERGSSLGADEVEVDAVSCGAPGFCSVGGHDSGDGPEAFVIDERNGHWGQPAPISGFAKLGGGAGYVRALSCAASGECVAAGTYDSFDDSNGYGRAFVATETRGRWRDATAVPGLAALARGYDSEVDTIVCPAPGDCALGGQYSLADPGSVPGGAQAFVADETNGAWGAASPVPGLAALNDGRYARVLSLSCVARGECAAGGFYTDDGGNRPFVVSETRGRWGDASRVVGAAGSCINCDVNPGVSSISCPKAGECAAGGYLSDFSCRSLAFVASETNGRWGKAVQVSDRPGVRGRGCGIPR